MLFWSYWDKLVSQLQYLLCAELGRNWGSLFCSTYKI